MGKVLLSANREERVRTALKRIRASGFETVKLSNRFMYSNHNLRQSKTERFRPGHQEKLH